MTSSLHRRALLVLWLMFALLPLRGWAVGVMDLPTLAPGVQAAVGAPCHDAEIDPSSATSHQLCTLCHAVAAPAPLAILPMTHAAADKPHAPAVHAVVDLGPAAPYKPPRR